MNNQTIQKLNAILDNLDSMAINTEVVENLNKLINDKLDSVRDLTLISDNKEVFYSRLYEAQRYSECYITLNYLLTKEIDKLNKSINDTFKQVRDIESLLKGGVINE